MNQIAMSRHSMDRRNLLLRICAVCWYSRGAEADVTNLQELVEDMLVTVHETAQGSQQLAQEIASQFMSDGRTVFSRETVAVLRRCNPLQPREIKAVQEILANTQAARGDSFRRLDPTIAALASLTQTFGAGNSVTAENKTEAEAPAIARDLVVATHPESNEPSLELEGQSEPLVLAQEDIEIPSIPEEIGREDDPADAYEDAQAVADSAEEGEDGSEKDADETDDDSNFSLADLFDEDKVVQDGGSLTLLADDDEDDQASEDDDERDDEDE